MNLDKVFKICLLCEIIAIIGSGICMVLGIIYGNQDLTCMPFVAAAICIFIANIKQLIVSGAIEGSEKCLLCDIIVYVAMLVCITIGIIQGKSNQFFIYTILGGVIIICFIGCIDMITIKKKMTRQDK